MSREPKPLNDAAEAKGYIVYVVTVFDLGPPMAGIIVQKVFTSLFDADAELARLRQSEPPSNPGRQIIGLAPLRQPQSHWAAIHCCTIE